MRRMSLLYWLILPLLLTACSSGQITREEAIGFSERGQASYYAMQYQGYQTASGEFFDQGKMTASHDQLPFGAIVRVTNVKNGRSVVVRVNDRGPFSNGRIIDLSQSAFQQIANPYVSVIYVQIEVIR